MPIFSESESKIFGDILFDVTENTNITRTSPGSKTRALAQATSKKLGRMWGQFDTNIVLSFLDGAEGKYLDFIGSMMGIPRLGEERAGATAIERVVKFYVDVGTFGDINSNSSIVIPSGTIISTGTNQSGILYRLPYSILLPATSTETFVAVEALRAGTTYNLGVNQLIYHNFTGYTNNLNDSLKVTNDAEIVSGQEVENDTNYSFRISNQVLVGEAANLTAIRLSALVVPGVADIILIPYNRGIGTTDLIVKSTLPHASDSLIAAVSEAVFKVSAQGTVPNVRAPIEIGMSMTGTLTLRERLSNNDQDNLTRSVVTNVTDYINNLDIGEDFIVNEVVERVMATSDVIKNVGQANKPLDRVYIHRPTRLEDNKVRSTLLGDFDPENEEKLLIEDRFAGATPIQFGVAT